jgi:hypothetical protein
MPSELKSVDWRKKSARRVAHITFILAESDSAGLSGYPPSGSSPVKYFRGDYV